LATIHVREVSEEALTILKVRAVRAGQSLQAYLRQLHGDEAAALTAEEAAEQARAIAARGAVTAADAVDAARDTRT
jgi:hypothetical protein